MITHTCPSSVIGLVRGNKDYSSRTDQALQSMLESHTPKLWVFGHFHTSFDEVINGTRFVCVDKNCFVDIDLDAYGEVTKMKHMFYNMNHVCDYLGEHFAHIIVDYYPYPTLPGQLAIQKRNNCYEIVQEEIEAARWARFGSRIYFKDANYAACFKAQRRHQRKPSK